jgi:hypothetical protein
MSETASPAPARLNFFETRRRDIWWAGPLLTGIGLLAFIVYATWAALVGDHYMAGPYLSPLYSPLFTPDWWSLSPAFLILWAPGGFRLTCYYYRKAYYRAFFFTPPACAVGGRAQRYRGERAILLFQNLHRFFLYPSLALVVILWVDAVEAYGFDDGFGIGVGSLVLTLNAFFLMSFTFGCNSFRHLVGGNVDCYSCVPFGQQRHQAWRFATWFNKNHMQWAWISLFWVGFTDLYVRLVSMGVITDLRLW